MPGNENKVHEHKGDKKNKKHPEREYIVCGAKHDNNKYGFCLQRAGWGTDHLGYGRCKLHGGKSTGPSPENAKKNKNAVKTGEYETIWLDTLTEEEKELYSKIRLDVIDQINEEIKLTDIRIRRMMQRIAKLSDIDYSVIERKFKEGRGPEGPVDIEEIKEVASLGQIQDIEEALTRVQSRKARLLKLKHRVESNEGPIDVDVTQYINALGGAAEEVWDDEKE